MSGPYRAYPGNQSLNPGAAQGGNQQVSFKTDINRQKTKKWVSAKSVSYDGDDWGDDDEEDEEEEAPPLPTNSMPRFERSQPPAQPPSIPPSLQPSTGSEPRSTGSPAFVRPADIYKRMQEERAKDSQPETSLGPTSQAAFSQEATPHPENTTNSSTSPLIIPELKRLSGFGSDFMSGTSLYEEPSQTTEATNAQSQPHSLHHNPSMGFTSVVNQAFDVPETPTSGNNNPSRSNSDSTSVISPIMSHGNWGSSKTPTITEDLAGEASAQELPANFKPGHRRDLSLPSPGNGPDKVPVIMSSGDSQHAEIVSSQSLDDISSPSNDSNPSSHHSEGSASGQATPKPASEPRQSIESPSLHSTESDNVPTKEPSQPPMPTQLHIPQDHADDIPQIVPSMSTDTSPQDLESDRLRKEIMRSLSPDPTAIGNSSEAGSQNPQQSQYWSGNEDTQLSKDHNGYLRDDTGIPSTSPLQPKQPTASASAAEPLSLKINPAATAEKPTEKHAASSTVSQSFPTLKKKFSWEVSEDSEEDVLEEQSERAPSPPTAQSAPVAEGSSIAKGGLASPPTSANNDIHHPTIGDEGSTLNEQDLPRYSTIANEAFERPGDTAPEVVPPADASPTAPLQEVEPSALPTSPSAGSPARATHREPTQPVGTEASLPSFRKIMEMPSGSEKIKAFRETREQFAQIENGLENWIRRSSESLPEHADLIRANGRLPGGAPTGALPPKNKFPKLSSLGNLALPSSHEGASQLGYSPSHVRRSSGSPLTGVINRQNVEAKGKDLLHSAGVFGGKAGGAARGLFAKGKSKLRGGADKGKASIFSGRRRSLQLSKDPSSTDLDPASDGLALPASLSTSSRYSLQPVPRIPSFKFSDGRPFSISLLDDTPAAPKPRAVSLDWGTQLNSLPEEEDLVSRPGSSSSLRKAMMQFHLGENSGNTNDDSGDLYSAHSHPSPRGRSLSIAEDDVRKQRQDTHAAVREDNPHGIENHRLGIVRTEDSFQRPPSLPDIATGASLSAVSSLSSHFNPKSAFNIQGTGSPRSSSPMLGRTSMGSFEGSNNAVPPFMERGPSLDLHRESLQGRRNASSPTHHVSRFYQTVSTIPRESAETNLGGDPNLDKVTSRETDVQNPVSPPLSDQDHNRRLSSHSQVSDMSKGEMDRIREKFDEDGRYSHSRSPSPTGSKVSALSEDKDKDIDAIIEEKLGGDDSVEDLEKSRVVQPRRASAPRQAQAISVVRLSRLPQDRRGSQSAESTRRYSRFSFESDGNATAEAMLVTRYRRPSLIDSSHERNMSSQLPPTLGEEAPDEPPPPFDDTEAPYGADEKDEATDDGAFSGQPPQLSPSPRYEAESTKQSPPRYQPLRSHPPNPEIARNRNRVSEPRTHRDSHNSSVSSLSNAITNSSAPRATISPEPVSSRLTTASSPPHTVQLRGSAREDLVPPSNKSRWTDGRFARDTQAGHVVNKAQHARSSNLFGPVKREEGSFGSGDSMGVQAASSRLDLRAEPSPLQQESETASAKSSNSFKVSVPFKNKIKISGLRLRTPSSEQPSAERPNDGAVIDKPKMSDKKAEGKKGALNKISGIFNRSGPNQRFGQGEGKPRSSAIHLSPTDPQQGAATWQPFPPLQIPPTNPTPQNVHLGPTPYATPASYPAHQTTEALNGKGLPPPPGGYYAPSPPMDAFIPQEYHAHYGAAGTYQQSNEQQQYPTKSAYAFYAPPEGRHSGSSHSYSVGSPVSGSGSAAWRKSSSPPLDRGRHRAQDLRLRSRSPVSQPVRPDRYSQNVNYSDPIYRLGKFHAVTETPRIGDQSTPFPITLPEEIDKDPLSPRGSIQVDLPANAETPSNPGLGLRQPGTTAQSATNPLAKDQALSNKKSSAIPHQHRSTQSPHASRVGANPYNEPQRGDGDQYYEDRLVKQKNVVPVELPVPRDDSSEEIVMSSTAYPGQEWQPSGFENWMPY